MSVETFDCGCEIITYPDGQKTFIECFTHLHKNQRTISLKHGPMTMWHP